MSLELMSCEEKANADYLVSAKSRKMLQSTARAMFTTLWTAHDVTLS
jgi:hypothetical protein